MKHKKETCLLKNQEGFTLIEIVAVLVILGILSVVAVPKYFNLQEQAQEKAMNAAKAEAIGRIHSYFAHQLLNDVSPEDIVYHVDNIGSDLGDFTLGEITRSTDSETGNPTLNFTVTANDETPLAGVDPLSCSIPVPGLDSSSSEE